MTSATAQVLWVGVPYAVIAIFIVGHWWRYRYQQFTWTTRSSQLLEHRMLKWGILLFHFGILAVIGGHIVGILIPESFTAWFGITEHMYHVVAVTLGSIAGIAVTAGILILLFRRATNDRVKAASLARDYLTAIALLVVIGTGMYETFGVQILGDPHNYRATVGPWFRSIFFLQPKAQLMAAAPFTFQLHTMASMLLFALWPFTRLVHAWSVPIAYMSRSWIIYRSRLNLQNR